MDDSEHRCRVPDGSPDSDGSAVRTARFEDCGQALNNGLALASVVGLLLAVIGVQFAGSAIRFLISDPAVISLAIDYTQWSFVGAACITVGYAFQGFFNGVERTRVHM